MQQDPDPGTQDRVFSDPTEGHVEQATPRRRSAGRGGRPGATAVLDVESAKVVAFEFEPGDELREHAARHPVLVQVLRGRVSFELPDRTVELVPGRVLHLTPMLRHAVTALEPTTLTVTMLLPHD